MNPTFVLLKWGGATLTAVVLGLFLASAAQAQTNLYFDPGAAGDANPGGATSIATGGAGTWDNGVADDWFLSSQGDVPFPANGIAIANFDATGGEVTVDGTEGAVQPANINFAGTGTYTLDATNGGTISETVNDAGPYADGTFLTVSSGNVILNAPSVITLPSDSPGAAIINSGTGNLTVNGSIAVSGSTQNLTGIVVNNTGGGTILFSSTVTNTPPASIPSGPVSSSNGQDFNLSFNGNAEFNGNILGTNSGFDQSSGSLTSDAVYSFSGTLLLDNSNFDRLVAQGGAALTNGAITITAATGFTSNGTLGSAKAGVSTFTGNYANFGGMMNLTAVAGSRVNFSGQLSGGGVGTTGNQLIKTGAGIVAFTAADGNHYATGYRGASDANPNPSSNEVGTEVQNGTLLLMNTTGSATGDGAAQPNDGHGNSTGYNNVVQIDNVASPTAAAPVAVLGGTGHTQQQVVAVGAHSTISPGDMDVTGKSAIGTLHLENGLTAANGLTVNFDLNGATSDTIAVSTLPLIDGNGNPERGQPAFALTLTGPVVFNFANLGDGVVAGQEYTLFTSAAGTAWNLDQGSFTFNAPDGFVVSSSGVVTDGATENYEVEFEAAPVPEPSTWALIGLGALLLMGAGRLRKLRAQN